MAPTRFELTDTEWDQIAALLPPEKSGRSGHPYKDHRLVVNAILWVLRTGAPWRDMPERYGPWQTAYDRFNRWRKDGTWAKVCEHVQIERDSDIDWEVEFVDGSIIKAHPHAAGAPKRKAKPLKRGRTTLRTPPVTKKLSAEVAAD
jgi:transposase